MRDVLRKEWGFNGYVVSDCDSIEDIWKYHKIVATPPEAAALAPAAARAFLPAAFSTLPLRGEGRAGLRRRVSGGAYCPVQKIGL